MQNIVSDFQHIPFEFGNSTASRPYANKLKHAIDHLLCADPRR